MTVKKDRPDLDPVAVDTVMPHLDALLAIPVPKEQLMLATLAFLAQLVEGNPVHADFSAFSLRCMAEDFCTPQMQPVTNATAEMREFTKDIAPRMPSVLHALRGLKTGDGFDLLSSAFFTFAMQRDVLSDLPAIFERLSHTAKKTPVTPTAPSQSSAVH